MNRCVFCAYHSEDAKNDASNVFGLHFKLSLDEFKRTVDICYDGRVPRVHICATGEPFLHTDILAMIDYVIDVYGYVSFQTSFPKRLLCKRDYLEEIVRRKDSITCITTDLLSGDPETHARLKKGSSYEDVLAAMEYISARSDIEFEAHYLVTKHNFEHTDALIKDLSRRGIKCHVSFVNLHAHRFNKFTSRESVYTSKDVQITEALRAARTLGHEKGIRVSIPDPADGPSNGCSVFWSRFQTWPAKGIDEGRYGENVLMGGCNAVVLGGLRSLGYLFDYENIMQLWNNEHFVRIRQNLINGIYPDAACRTCQHFNGAPRMH